ncbi:MAG: translocation/assembly module TamB domain-containing protein, partial [Bacteroidetes bacterium]|nr:translocation/assembly module TamB domain-containing protein [Bacteroidota bacterium]
MLFAIMLMMSGIFIAIKNSTVQTWVTAKVASYLSKEFGTRVEISRVDIDFFKTLVLEGIYIEDQHKDTLIYSESIKADIALLSFKELKLSINNIILEKADFNLKYYPGEENNNLQYIIDYFSSNDTSSSAPWQLNLGQLKLINAHFSFQNMNYPEQDFGINYQDIEARNINIDIRDIYLKGDTIFADIKNISCYEKSGFQLSGFSAVMKLSPRFIDLKNLKIISPESNISTNLSFSYEQWPDWLDFNQMVLMRTKFQPSVIDFSDIAYFAPALKGMQKKLSVTGDVRGTIDNLRAKDIDIAFGNNTHFKGDININGLPAIDETYMHLTVNHFTTSKADLDHIPIPPFDKKTMLETPDNFNLLGIIRFKGNFTGFYNDFVAYGDFNTSLGKLSSDIALNFDSLSKKTYYKGKLATQNFDVGKFFDVKEMGSISLNADINGSGFTKDELKASLNGLVNRFEINNYHYNNIVVSAEIANRLFEGSLKVEDENLDLSFDGSVDFTGKLPVFDFYSDIRLAHLSKLKIANRDTSSNLSTKISIKLTGDKLDNIEGVIDLHNTYYSEKELSYYASKISLTSEINNQEKLLSLNSDLAEAKIRGQFNIEYLVASLTDLFYHAISSQSFPLQAPKDKVQDFVFEIDLKDIKPVTELFLPAIEIGKNTQFSGKFNSASHLLTLNGKSTKVKAYNFIFKDFYINADTEDKTVNLLVGSTEVMVNDSFKLENFQVDSRTKNNLMEYQVSWDNKREIKNKADIHGSIAFTDLSKYKVEFKPSDIYISDSLWSITDNNYLLVDSNSYTFHNLNLISGTQEIGINGIVSNNLNDNLKVRFKDFNLENVNRITENAGVNLSGLMNGSANFSQVYHNMLFTTSLDLKQLKINGENIGDGNISTNYSTRDKSIKLSGRFFRGTIPTIEFAGNYFPARENNNLDMNLKLEKLQLQMIDKWVKDFITDIRGLASGELSIKGEINKPLIKGKISLQKTGFLVNFLNTHYTFSNDVLIDHDKIHFENISLFDARGNKSNVSGKVTHQNFSNFHFDVLLEPKNFMALNTLEHHNPLYFGTAFVTGKVLIAGPLDKINIDIVAKSERGTVFNIPLTGSEEIAESNFITFINRDTSSIKVRDEYKVDVSGIAMKFELDVTPDAEVLLIFDPKVGDIMRGKGQGHLSMEINTLGKFTIFGDFTIEDGDYLFTLMNVINKKFKVEKGGTIKWAGDPYNAKLDMNAIYGLRTSLYDLGGDIDTTKRRVPVNVVLAMRNDLMKPDIHFDIN